MQKISPTQHLVYFLFVLVLAIYGESGLYHITQFMTADEHYWVYERIPQYWKAWQDGKLKKTFINDKPGVALALVSGMALLAETDPGKHCRELPNRLYQCHVEQTESILFSFRFPILLFNCLILLYLFWIIGKISNQWIALWTTTLTALSPITLGISQIVNPDALLWSTGAAGLLSFYAVLKFRKIQYALWTILFTALALLSKYTALILIPFYALLAFLTFLIKRELHKIAHPAMALSVYLTWLGVVTLGAFCLFVLFLPAILIDPSLINEYLMTVSNKKELALITLLLLTILLLDFLLLRGRTALVLRQFLINRTPWFRFVPIVSGLIFLGIILSRWVFPEWHIFSIPFDIKDITDARYHGKIPNLPETVVLEWSAVLFSLTPVMLLGLSLVLIGLTQRVRREYSFLVFTVLFFLAGFTTLLIHSNVLATARYVILFYPLLGLIASIGFWYLAQWLHSFCSRSTLWISLILILVSAGTLALSAPFYFNYTNFFLPKNSLIHDAWGYGGYEAAQYLNQLPDAENQTVWADYYGVCEFFIGKCLTAYTFDANEIIPDYYVLTRRGAQRYLSRQTRWERLSGLMAYRYYDDPSPLWSLEIDGRPENFIKIYKVNNDFRVSIITDIDHCPSREAVSENYLNSFLSFSRDQKSDLIVSLGDNASHRLRSCSLTGDEDVRYIAERLRSAGLPTHFVLGDHDIASSTDSYQAWLATTEKETSYYSFDRKGVHVIVLDTVLGGDPMRLPCSEDSICASLEKQLHDIQTLNFFEYQSQYPDSLTTRSSELQKLYASLQKERTSIDLVRSFGNRDQGRVGQKQLAWLQEDLKKTPLQRVIIFSDHPLFPFSSNRKSYNIVGSDEVLKILELSQKQIVAISGEAHLWHETTIKNIQFYIIDEFRKANGSWAHFTWDNNGFRLEKITHEE